MAKFKYVAVDPSGGKVRGKRRSAERRCACATSCWARARRGRDEGAQDLHRRSRSPRRRSSRAEIMHFSRQIGGVRARRHPDRRRDRDGRRGRRRTRGSAGPRSTSPTRSRAARRSPMPSPRTATSSRPTTSASCARPSSPASSTSCSTSSPLHRARPRGPPEDEVGAHVPGRHLRDVDRDRRHPGAYVLPRFTTSSRASTPSSRCRPGCCSTSADFIEQLVVGVLVGDPDRRRSSCCSALRTEQRPAGARPDPAAGCR